MFPDAKNVDNHPLMYPYDIGKDAKAFPLSELIPTPEPQSFSAVPVVVASATSIALIALCLLVYFKKRKH